MAPKLRSSSHARSNNSRPSTPLDAQPASSATPSATESTRDKKRRRTGKHTRVATATASATDTPRKSPSPGSEQLRTGNTDITNELHAQGFGSDWVEPPLKYPAPSYADTPWSAVSNDANPILSTMRPLGAMPSAADLRKVGLAPSKPTPQPTSKKETQQTIVINGDKEDETTTPMTAAEEQVVEPAPSKVNSVPFLTAFETIPVHESEDFEDFDMEKIKSFIKESLLTVADKKEYEDIARGFVRLWKECTKDPFAMSLLNGMCGDDEHEPSKQQEIALMTYMRKMFAEQEGEEDTEAPAMTRTQSASTVSSLSSAKSLDVETFAPGMASGAGNPRSRAKGKQAKAKTKAKEVPRSAFPSSTESANQRKRALEEDPAFSDEAISNKRARLQKPLPNTVGRESKLRLVFNSKANSGSKAASPIPNATSAAEARRESILNGMERSESPASSDAEDNRRLTPTIDDEEVENNDFCRNCNGNGNLLCCDGCVNSFHFSCLNPPMDPANPPEGEWYCPKCSCARPMRALLGKLDKVDDRDFALPTDVREYFSGVKTGDHGRYVNVAPLPRISSARQGRKETTGRYDDPHLYRTVDAKGNLIFCTACGRISHGRPIIQCDYCPCAFHLDCLDPPEASPHWQKPGSDKASLNWMCPNHVYHDLLYTTVDDEGYEAKRRFRQPKDRRLVDVEILPDESESEDLSDKEEGGVTYRLPEKGVKLNFLERVIRENAEAGMKKASAAQYLEYAKAKLDKLTSNAEAFYATKSPSFPPDTTADVLNSRTAVEREAAANLVALAQGPEQVDEGGKINLLIDQLRAHAPRLPSPETEVASLRGLQALIEQRIRVLTAQAEMSATTGS